MSEEKHKNINSDDEDDLESLRIAALKSINSKRDSSPNKSQIKIHGIGNSKLQLQVDNQPALSSKEAVFSNMAHSTSQHKNSLVLQSYGVNSDMDAVRPIGLSTYFPQTKSYLQHPVNPVMNIYPHVSSFIPSTHPRPILHSGPTIINNVPRPPGPVRHWIPPEQTTHNGSAVYNANKGVAPYTPKPINKDTHVTDVQLSPRSLAFVAQNNGILARRKIEADLSPKKHYRRSKSPNYRRISRSPTPPYRTSPERWSVSPPPHSIRQRFSKSKTKSPSRRSRSKPFQYSYKRSRSRSSSESRHLNERKRRSFSRSSDYRTLSPGHYNRHSSRSPPQISKTVNVVRRNKSRSPLRRYSPVHTLPHRRLSRSRSPRRNYFEHRKSRSPQTIRKRISPNLNKRNQRRPLERKSPVRSKRKSPLSRENIRRDSPLQNNNFTRRLGRKSLSPQLRKRSRTPRSPGATSNKKYIRKSRDRQIPTSLNSQSQYSSTNIRKRSPNVNTFKNRNNETYNSNNTSNNNNNLVRTDLRNKTDFELRKSKSPLVRKQRSRSKTLEKTIRKEELKKENELSYNRDYEKKNQKTVEVQSNQISCTSTKLKETIEKHSPKSINETIRNKVEESKTPPPSEDNFESLTPPIDKDMDDAKLIEEIDAMLGDSKSNLSNSSDEEDDGIDLFASEESESENEGRFKLSNKTERNANVQAMSFTKLKESISTTSNVRNLQDVVNDEKYTDNQNKNKKDYFKKYSRNIKNDNRRLGDDYSSSKRRSRSSSIDKNKFSDNNENSNKSKFKSTFQVIKNEGSRVLSKPSPKNNNRSTPERNVKKRSKDHSSSEHKDRKTTGIESMNTPPHLLEQLRSNNSHLYGKSGYGHGQQKHDKVIETSKSSKSSSISSRKSIHSRLGAMTNTFKTPSKASWSTNNSSYNDQV